MNPIDLASKFKMSHVNVSTILKKERRLNQ